MNQKDTQFQKKTGIGNYTYPFPSLGNSFKDSTGQYFTPVFTLDAIIKNQTPIENEILAKYNVKAWKELYPQKDQFKVKAYGAMYLINIDDTDISNKRKNSPDWLQNDTCCYPG